jgi:hypothetical protein
LLLGGLWSVWLSLDADALVVLVVVGTVVLEWARFLPCGFVEVCFAWFKQVGKKQVNSSTLGSNNMTLLNSVCRQAHSKMIINRALLQQF